MKLVSLNNLLYIPDSQLHSQLHLKLYWLQIFRSKLLDKYSYSEILSQLREVTP